MNKNLLTDHMLGQPDQNRYEGSFFGHAALCAGCGATVPNSWSDPHGYVFDLTCDAWYCDAQCEHIHKTPQTEERMDCGRFDGQS